MRCKRVVYLLRAAVLSASLLLSATAAQAQSKKQLEQDKAKIEKEIARLNNELSQAKKNTRNSTRQIKLLSQRISERNKLIQNINGQMNLLDRQIGVTEDSLRTMRGQIDSMKAEYANVVRTLYRMQQNLTPLGLLFDNETYNMSYLKLKYFNEYARFRKFQAAQIQRQQRRFEDLSLDLQRQRNEKTTLLAQERKQKEALAREQKHEQSNLSNSQKQEKTLRNQISRKEKEKRALQQQIQQIINEEVAKAAGGKKTPHVNTNTNTGSGSTGKSASPSVSYSDPASSEFASNKGRMAWPVYYKSVAREYGVYTHASGGQNRNYGIDLVCAPGATVSAVCNGVVSRVFTTPNGTKGVLVRHGGYMTVYAGLGSVSVSQGSKVSARQALGTVASTGEENSEFSFQVWAGKDALNPRHWLK